MDAQFIYVPKTWVRGILKVRIAKVMFNIIYKSHDRLLDEIGMLRRDELLTKLQEISADKTDFCQSIIKKLNTEL